MNQRSFFNKDWESYLLAKKSLKVSVIVVMLDGIMYNRHDDVVQVMLVPGWTL